MGRPVESLLCQTCAAFLLIPHGQNHQSMVNSVNGVNGVDAVNHLVTSHFEISRLKGTPRPFWNSRCKCVALFVLSCLIMFFACCASKSSWT